MIVTASFRLFRLQGGFSVLCLAILLPSCQRDGLPGVESSDLAIDGATQERDLLACNFVADMEIFCGGGCPPCLEGDRCNADGDCESGACRGHLCAPGGRLRWQMGSSLAVGPRANNFVVADVDGDGLSDLVATTGLTNVVTFLGRGDGTFMNGVDRPAGIGGTGPIGLGDFNNDGHIDLLVGGEGGLSYLAGRQGGLFDTAVVVTRSLYVLHLVVADLDGDKALDAAMTAGQVGLVRLIHGKGDGTFGKMSDIGVDSGAFGIAAWDFNGDGLQDLAVTVSRAVGLLAQNAQHGFVYRTIPNNDFPTALAVVDLDRDGFADIVTSNLQASFSIYPGKASGAFGPAQSGPSGSSPVAVATGDLDGDGLTDFVIASDMNNELRPVLMKPMMVPAPEPGLPLADSPVDLAVADLNRDGRADLLVSLRGSGVIRTILQKAK